MVLAIPGVPAEALSALVPLNDLSTGLGISTVRQLVSKRQEVKTAEFLSPGVEA